MTQIFALDIDYVILMTFTATKNVKKNVAVQKEEQVTNVTQNCCSCKDPQKEMVSDKERINEINFEDSLQNIVFQKRLDNDITVV